MFVRIGMACAVLISFGLAPAFAKPTIVEFDPPGADSGTTVPRNSIDKKGNIGGYYCCDSQEVGFIRHPDGTYVVAGPADDFIWVEGMAKGGLLTGENDVQAFIIDSKGHVTAFRVPGVSGDGTNSVDILADGTAVGYFNATSGLWRGFIRDNAGNFTIFDAPKAGIDRTGETAGTFVSAANDKGDIVGWSVDDNQVARAYLRSSNGHFKLLQLAKKQKSAHAYCINKKGTVGGTYYDVDGHNHGFVRDQKGNVTTIDIDGATLIQVSGVNANGDATGYYQGSDQVQHGFVRLADGKISSVDAPDAGGTIGKGTLAQSINDAGVVAGYYQDSNGHNHGFVRTP
jgi:hypothetical protein